MLTCKETSFKVAESLDQKLPLSERFMMRTHLLMCKSCQLFSKQMQLLNSASQQHSVLTENSIEQIQEKLSEEAHQRIMDTLRSA